MPAAPSAASRSTAPTCSARSRPRLPTFRRTASAPSSCSPTARCTTCRPSKAGLPPNAPLHVLLSGHAGETDRRIVIDSAPRFGIVDESQVIKFRVVDDGVTGNDPPVTVSVNVDGEPLSTAKVLPGVPSQFVVDIAHGGPNIIEFEAEPLAGELTPVNNRAVVSIEGIRENLRVLLVSGEPHAGERTWRNLLKSDAAVDLVHFTILRPPEKQDGTPINQLSLIAFPTRELFSEKIDQFDLIIFDRYQHRGVLPLLYFDNIARYVRDGGALLVAAGPDYAGADSIYDTPLSPVLPAGADRQGASSSPTTRPSPTSASAIR